MHRDDILESKTTILKLHILRKEHTEELFASAPMLVVVDWYICVTTTEGRRILVMRRSCFCKAHPIHNVNSPHLKYALIDNPHPARLTSVEALG